MSSKISALSAASALDGTETFPLVQSSTTKKGLISAIATYLAGIAAWLPFTKLTGSVAVAQMGAAGYANSSFAFTATGVNANSGNTDTAIPISLPTGFTRYYVTSVRLSHASGTLTTMTFGCFNASGGGGTALITSGTACTINTASDGTNNNAQNASGVGGSTLSMLLANFPNVYFRVQTPQGAAQTFDVTIIVVPAP